MTAGQLVAIRDYVCMSRQLVAIRDYVCQSNSTGYLQKLFHFLFLFSCGALRCTGAPVCSFQHIMHGRAGAPSGKIYLVGILNFDLSNLILPRVANF